MTWMCLIWAVRPMQKLPETPEERMLCGILILVGLFLAFLLTRPMAAQWRNLPTRPRQRRRDPGKRGAGDDRIRHRRSLRELATAAAQRNNLAGADLAGENLAGAEFESVILSGADLTEATLTRARLVRAQLVNARLSRADLTGATLREASLSGARLNGAVLTNANLVGADLHGADLTAAQLAGARYDGRTRWPAGFDPREHGAVLVDEHARSGP